MQFSICCLCIFSFPLSGQKSGVIKPALAKDPLVNQFLRSSISWENHRNLLHNENSPSSISHYGLSSATTQRPIIAGSGDWKFRYCPECVQLPQSILDNMQDGHGLAKDDNTNHFFFTYNAIQKNTTQVLVRYSDHFKNQRNQSLPSKQPLPEILGDPLLSLGTPHGLRLEKQNDTHQYLYHANNNQRVTKTTLQGDIVWSTDFSHWNVTHPQYWPIRPTDAIVVPTSSNSTHDEGLLLVADGYGSGWVHTLNKTTGEYLEGRSFGGRGSGPDEPSFALPHSISLDYASVSSGNGGSFDTASSSYKNNNHKKKEQPLFIVSDRNNQRLVWVTADGKYIKEQRTDTTGTPLPCNIDNSYVEEGKRYAAIPSLGHDYGSLVNGSVSIYESLEDDNDAGIGTAIVARIEIAQLLGRQGHQHPHDAILLSNGDLVVCCWSGPPNPNQGQAKGTISYWERLRSVTETQAPIKESAEKW